MAHFRAVQGKHEKARRRDVATEPEFSFLDGEAARPPPTGASSINGVARPPMRRKVSQPAEIPQAGTSRQGALSPLNPRRGGLLGYAMPTSGGNSTREPVAPRPSSPTSLARDKNRKVTGSQGSGVKK